MGMRIGLLGKGGSGKSTVAILLAKALGQRDYPVCLLDADSTNIGTHLALGLQGPPQPLLDYFGGMVFSGGLVTCPVDDPTPLEGAEIDLETLPAAFHAQGRHGVHLLTAGKIGELGPGAGCDGPIAKIARDLRVRCGDHLPVTIVDFKAGFEDTARGVFTGLDWLVTVIDPTTASIHIAVHLKELLHKLKAGAPPATEHLEDPHLVALAHRFLESSQVMGVLAVLNKVRGSEEESFLRQALRTRGIEVLASLPENPEIREAWLRGRPLPEGYDQHEIGALISALERRQSLSARKGA
jgi:CO dehydrogenase maturation factor